MTFTYNGTQYRIYFQYSETLSGYRATFCKVVGGVSNAEIGVGHSICVPTDQFVYEVGRKRALRRALHGLPRDFRTAAWEAYHSRSGRSRGTGVGVK